MPCRAPSPRRRRIPAKGRSRRLPGTIRRLAGNGCPPVGGQSPLPERFRRLRVDAGRQKPGSETHGLVFPVDRVHFRSTASFDDWESQVWLHRRLRGPSTSDPRLRVSVGRRDPGLLRTADHPIDEGAESRGPIARSGFRGLRRLAVHPGKLELLELGFVEQGLLGTRPVRASAAFFVRVESLPNGIAPDPRIWTGPHADQPTPGFRAIQCGPFRGP